MFHYQCSMFLFRFFSPGPLAIRRAKSVPSRSRGFWRNSWMTMLHQADTVSETLEGCSLDYIYMLYNVDIYIYRFRFILYNVDIYI